MTEKRRQRGGCSGGEALCASPAGAVGRAGREPGLRCPDHLEMLALPGSSPWARPWNPWPHSLKGANEVAEALAASVPISLRQLDLKSAVPAGAGRVRWPGWRPPAGACQRLNLSPVEVGPHSGGCALYAGLGSAWSSPAPPWPPPATWSPTRLRLGLDTEDRDPSGGGFALQSGRSRRCCTCPESMPDPPISGEFAQRPWPKEVEALLSRSAGGRAFVLFTSHRNLREFVSGLLARQAATTRCLVQGRGPAHEAAGALQGARRPACFWPRPAFWQGVDVPGEALSAVIVDKLPFAPPDDPLVAARIRKSLEEPRAKAGLPISCCRRRCSSLKPGAGAAPAHPGRPGALWRFWTLAWPPRAMARSSKRRSSQPRSPEAKKTWPRFSVRSPAPSKLGFRSRQEA
jgi:hypothetical protein